MKIDVLKDYRHEDNGSYAQVGRPDGKEEIVACEGIVRTGENTVILVQKRGGKRVPVLAQVVDPLPRAFVEKLPLPDEIMSAPIAPDISGHILPPKSYEKP